MENSKLLNDRLPFGNAKMFLGIAAIVFSPILVGFIFGVISVFLVDKDNKMLKSFPQNYNTSAISNHKTGTILAWIGFVVSLLVAAYILYIFYQYGTFDSAKIEKLKVQGGLR